MAWIKTIDESEAQDDLAEVYDDISLKRGKLSNIMRAHSLNPQAMKEHMGLYLAVMFGRSGIRRPDRELIGAVVSAVNECPYCISHHSEALNHYWKDADRVETVVRGRDFGGLSPLQRAMLDYATKLTRHPEAAAAEDVQRLRDAGLTDRDILDVNLITSYFNFVNRIALGLGVEFDADEMAGYTY